MHKKKCARNFKMAIRILIGVNFYKKKSFKFSFRKYLLIQYLYRSLYRSSLDAFSLSPPFPLGRFSSGVELRDEWSSGVGLRLEGARPLPVLLGTGAWGGKCPGGKLWTGGALGLKIDITM